MTPHAHIHTARHLAMQHSRMTALTVSYRSQRQLDPLAGTRPMAEVVPEPKIYACFHIADVTSTLLLRPSNEVDLSVAQASEVKELGAVVRGSYTLCSTPFHPRVLNLSRGPIYLKHNVGHARDIVGHFWQTLWYRSVPTWGSFSLNGCAWCSFIPNVVVGVLLDED